MKATPAGGKGLQPQGLTIRALGAMKALGASPPDPHDITCHQIKVKENFVRVHMKWYGVPYFKEVYILTFLCN